MRHPLLLLLAVAALLCPARADAKWTQVRSANFIFVGEVSEGQIRRIAEKLEQFREVMLRALPGATATSPVPTVVMVFANQRSLQPVAPLFRGNAIEVGGYFQQGEDLNYIVLDAEYIDLALLTIFHEYSHFLVANSVGPLPVWANEGLAEVYELVDARDGGKKALVGQAPLHHVELLKASTLIPIRDLLAIDQTSSVYNEGNRRSVLYAQSWALVHYLSFGNPERRKQFNAFLGSVRGGMEPVAAFTQAFGDPGALDRELFDYVRKYLFPAIMFDFGEKVAAKAVQKGRTIDDVEGSIYVADVQGRVGREAESRTRLAAVLKQNPNAARAHAALGMQRFRAGELDAALPLLEKAAAIGRDDGWVQNAYGRALIAHLGKDADGDSSATLQRARAVLGKAVELDATSAFAAAMLGYVELLSNGDLVRATSLLERAVQMAPSREQYRLFLAQALMRQREFGKAINHLGPLVASGRDPQTRSQARDLLGRAATMKNQPAATEAPAPPTVEELAALANLSRSAEGTSTPAGGATAAGGAAGGRPAGARRPGATFRPDLRPVGTGETRAQGQFSAIECGANGAVLVVQTTTGPLRLRAKQLAEVDFISYRTDTPGSVSCGALSTPQPVLVTYRAGVAGAGPTATAGDAVAIELLPDNFTP